MERFILFIITSIVSADVAFAVQNNDTFHMYAEKYPLLYVSLPAKIIQNQEDNHQHKSEWKEPTMQIYCFQAASKHWHNLWTSVSMEISLPPQDYERFYGSSPQGVIDAFEQRNIFWQSIKSLVQRTVSWKSKNIRANPGGNSCVGIYGTKQQYEIFLYLQQIDFWKPTLLTSGIVLYLLAPKLSRSTIFYYVCTIILGQFAALLLSIYFIKHFIKIPKGQTLFYGFLTAGWLLGSLPLIIRTITQNLSDFIKNFASQNVTVVLAYLGVTSLMSVVICYRMELATNSRTRNLVQWTMQILSLYLMYVSSELQDVSIAIIVIFLTIMNFPRGVFKNLKPAPTPRKLLTEEEYRNQGFKHTSDSLNQLRDFCASPSCDQWTVIRNLTVPPKKIANFVLGSSHVTQEEIANHQKASGFTIFTEEESEDSDL